MKMLTLLALLAAQIATAAVDPKDVKVIVCRDGAGKDVVKAELSQDSPSSLTDLRFHDVSSARLKLSVLRPHPRLYRYAIDSGGTHTLTVDSVDNKIGTGTYFRRPRGSETLSCTLYAVDPDEDKKPLRMECALGDKTLDYDRKVRETAALIPPPSKISFISNSAKYPYKKGDFILLINLGGASPTRDHSWVQAYVSNGSDLDMPPGGSTYVRAQTRIETLSSGFRYTLTWGGGGSIVVTTKNNRTGRAVYTKDKSTRPATYDVSLQNNDHDDQATITRIICKSAKKGITIIGDIGSDKIDFMARKASITLGGKTLDAKVTVGRQETYPPRFVYSFRWDTGYFLGVSSGDNRLGVAFYGRPAGK